MTDTMPNFLVVGAGKAGTTSLYYYLKQIDSVFLPVLKEPHFFVYPEVENRIANAVGDEANYRNLYAAGKSESWRGDMSVCYLYYAEQAIPRILSKLGPSTKIGIMVRNPIERAYSAYLDVYRHNSDENLSFDAALEAEPERMLNPRLTPMMYYKDMGLYSRRVAAYMAAFESVQVIVADDFRANPVAVINQFVEFLGGVRMPDELDLQIHNVGGTSWKNSTIAAWIKRAATSKIRSAAKKYSPTAYTRVKKFLFGSMMRKAEPLSPNARAILTDYYRNDVAQLGDMLGRDLGHWLR